MAGWQPDNGSYNWECLDAILKWTFYTLVPITILRPIQKLDTAHEIFNYLAKRFCDNNPIVDPCAKKSKPSANKVKQAGTAAEDISADSEKWKESPMSENAAMERHASGKRDEEDPHTKDLSTRGTECVNKGSVRCKDLHTSTDAVVTGTSMECTDGTPVLFTGTPHETQTEPQDSLPLTPRLPTDGKPNGCKQEVANSDVMAECMNGMVGMAEPTKIADVNSEKAALDGEPAERARRVDEGDKADADVDRTALLGRELAERACGVNKSNRMECEPQSQLGQQTILYCKEDQHSGNANANVPSTYGVPLTSANQPSPGQHWTALASTGQ